MPARRKQPTDVGPINLKFTFQSSQKRLMQYVQRGAGSYLQLKAPQCLEVGGQRSGKTVGKLMFGIENYCWKYKKCNILVLRRTFPELDAGVIQDFKTFVPAELFDFNATTRVATFKANGSQIVFAGCANNVERDIEKYLGQAYPYILVDECAQFSNTVWERLFARNLVNAACEADDCGNLPIPAIVGCTNPIGAFWEYYYTVFVKKEPWERGEGIQRAVDGSWWVPSPDGWSCTYNPANYAFNHTTVLDNDAYLKRDPGIIARLKSMSKPQMQRFLLGMMDKVAGQYYNCWNEEHHVIDLRTDPEAIVWQDWQPVWCGQDFGVGHWNAVYFFTKALVKVPRQDSLEEYDYKLKTVCFAEIAPETTGYTDVQLADMVDMKAHYPKLPEDHPQFERISGKRCKVSAIYFSHEKFSKQMEAHTPADNYSRLLRERGLPSVTPATRNRIGRATLLYNMLKTGQLVILRNCPGIITAIPSLQCDDPDNLDDVKKSTSKADDRYDAFSYGLFGHLNPRGTPEIEKAKAYAEKLDPFSRHFYMMKQRSKGKGMQEEFKQQDVPYWQNKT